MSATDWSPEQLEAHLLADGGRTAKYSSFRSLVDPIAWVTDGRHTSDSLTLFDDVAQLYELILARMEFSTLGEDLEVFRRRTAYFETVSEEKTYHSYVSSVRGKGQIGHSNQYLTHWFYPYKGKYHGQMVKALVNFMGAKGDSLVVDPFVGSGTTLIECALLGVPSIGIDINPALSIVSQIKVDCLTIDFPELAACLNGVNAMEVFLYFRKVQDAVRTPWPLGPERLNSSAVSLLEEAWEDRFPRGFVKELPFKWRNFLFLCYLHALSDYTYLKGTNKAKSLEEFFLQDLNEYLASVAGTYNVLSALRLAPTQPEVRLGSGLQLQLPDNSVDGVVTSPPYSIALDYVRNDQHLLDYLSIDTSQLRQQMVGLKGRKADKIRLYEGDIKKSLSEIRRVLKPGGHAAVVLGDVVVNASRTNFCYKILSWAPSLGFSEAEAIRRPILGGFARLRYEYIVLLRK